MTEQREGIVSTGWFAFRKDGTRRISRCGRFTLYKCGNRMWAAYDQEHGFMDRANWTTCIEGIRQRLDREEAERMVLANTSNDAPKGRVD